MTNGSLVRSGDSWIARPERVGEEAVVSITASMDGRPVNVASSTFRVRRLPDPTPFIAYTDASGAVEHYRGGRPIQKAILLNAQSLQAAIDDGLLDTPFEVLSFETVMFDSMGNAITDISQGAAFSPDRSRRYSVSAAASGSIYQESAPKVLMGQPATRRQWKLL